MALGRSDLMELIGSVLSGAMAAYGHTRATLAAMTAEAEGCHAEALGSYRDAEVGWNDFRNPYERTQCLIGQARCALALGRMDEAMGPLGEARERFTALGATPALEETDRLLRRASVGG